MVEVKPILDKHGEPILWDIYVDGQWLGSRRVKEYAEQYAEWWKKQ